eukprot:2518459-Prymnesium_polylepis.2
MSSRRVGCMSRLSVLVPGATASSGRGCRYTTHRPTKMAMQGSVSHTAGVKGAKMKPIAAAKLSSARFSTIR